MTEKRCQTVIMNLGYGSLYKGFPQVTVSVLANGRVWGQIIGKLPAARKIVQLKNQFAIKSGIMFRKITVNPNQQTNFSISEIKTLAQEYRRLCNDWLQSRSFRPVADFLRENLHRDNEIHFIIQTDDRQLQKFPWHLWNLFDRYPHSEVAFSPLCYERVSTSVKRDRLRILAVFGCDTQLNLEADRQALENLSAETIFLFKPTREVLNQQLWDEKGWDLFCFSGHSWTKTDVGGIICLNETEKLAIADLNKAFSAAIKHGLKLAIFNSCDGFGLANALLNLNIPQAIAMRDRIPDRVAQDFLTSFLLGYSRGHSIFTSVRQAKEKLHSGDYCFPCASWLPAIFQNPALEPINAD